MRESDQVWATVSHALMLTSAPNQKEQCWWTFQEAADLFEICVPAVCDISEFTKQQVSAEMVVFHQEFKILCIGPSRISPRIYCIHAAVAVCATGSAHWLLICCGSPGSAMLWVRLQTLHLLQYLLWPLMVYPSLFKSYTTGWANHKQIQNYKKA